MTEVVAVPTVSRAVQPGVALAASAYVGFSAPEALDFFRLVPVGAVLLIWSIHLLLGRPGLWRSVRLPLPVLLLVSWLALTLFWTEGRFITAVQVVSTALVVAVALILAVILTPAQLLQSIVAGGLAVLLLSVLVAVVSPSTGLMPAGYQGGTLRGIYVHRNLLAEVLTPAFVAALAHRFGGVRPAWRKSLVILALGAGIALTSSSTALASVAAAVAVVLVLLPVRIAPRQARPAVAVLVAGVLSALALYALSHVADVLGLLGRDSTFTGRALIWEQVRALIDRRPLTGWGWGAVWGDTDFVRLTVEAVAHFEVPSAHNGYLDAWLQSGAIGLALFLLLVGSMLVRGLGALLARGDRLGLWATLSAAALLVYNVGEADLVAPLTILWVVATGAALVRMGAARPDPGSGEPQVALDAVSASGGTAGRSTSIGSSPI